MPVATPEQYADMLDRAKAGGFAYPAINVSSSQSINAVLQGLTEAGSAGFVIPLIEASEEEVKAGRNPIFQSHMWDGSAVPLDENIEIAKELLPRLKNINAILEVEIGVVGGEEDGVKHEGTNDALYTTTADVSKFVEALGLGENGRYIAALTFGNVHGVYKPGNVKLRPELLGEIQEGIAAKFGTGEKPL